ncbi:hypothetical protein [Thermomonas aquatica]|jgi:hypothetical protein|uniref:Flippase-like domain-containing protein n=1 Tax=Thermomonas aquatica TaxID=2202149 RepID=A0A5B7ZNL7_9GAMM|nr:hypothetical protein [Thermomonas aquatica]QDA56854.1 hypothetical protein FHQ07_05745 [Thermomonas aquatica]
MHDQHSGQPSQPGISPAITLARKALRIAKLLFTPAAVAFLLYFAWESRESLREVVASGQLKRLPIAVLLWSLMPLLAPLFAQTVFRALGHRFSYRRLAVIHIGNLPARYIPGGIWHTVGRVTAFSDLGAGKRDIAVFVLLENVLAVSLAFVLGGPLVALYRGLTDWGLIAALAGIGGTLGLTSLPWLLNHHLARRRKKFPAREYLMCAGTVAISWCIGATAFVVFLTAFPDLDMRFSALETGATYLFAWGMGFIAFFAPQGIGVFEAVAGDMISGTGSIGNVAALLAGFRLIILLSDALVWGMYQLGRMAVQRRKRVATNATRAGTERN